MRIEYHRTLLADRVRNAAFHAALQQAIVKGESTVADIGAGTGFLGFLAAKLGARRVDLYEAAEIAGVARKLLRHNRLANCRIAELHSTEVATPDRVDVVVCETLGNYPFEENIIATLNDARARFLKAGGVTIPHSIEQFVAPVIGERYYRELAVWDEVGYDLDLTPAKTMSLNNIYVRTLAPSELLEGGGSAVIWDRIDFALSPNARRKGEAKWKLRRPAVIYGFATWWTAELVPGVHISTAPDAPKTHWEQLYFPLLAPIEGQPGETVAVRLNSRSSQEAGTLVAWTGLLLDKTGKLKARQALDLDKGFLP